MNEALFNLLGRERYRDHLREADAARLASRIPDPGLSVRRRLGLALVRVGTALAGPAAGSPATRPVNGHRVGEGPA